MWSKKKKEPVTFYVRILYDLFLWLAWPLSVSTTSWKEQESSKIYEGRLQEREQGVRRRKKEEETFFFRSCLLFAKEAPTTTMATAARSGSSSLARRWHQ